MADPFGIDCEKNNYWLIRPKLGKIVVSKEAQIKLEEILILAVPCLQHFYNILQF
jgi:hypothetical protein